MAAQVTATESFDCSYSKNMANIPQKVPPSSKETNQWPLEEEILIHLHEDVLGR